MGPLPPHLSRHRAGEGRAENKAAAQGSSSGDRAQRSPGTNRPVTAPGPTAGPARPGLPPPAAGRRGPPLFPAGPGQPPPPPRRRSHVWARWEGGGRSLPVRAAAARARRREGGRGGGRAPRGHGEAARAPAGRGRSSLPPPRRARAAPGTAAAASPPAHDGRPRPAPPSPRLASSPRSPRPGGPAALRRGPASPHPGPAAAADSRRRRLGPESFPLTAPWAPSYIQPPAANQRATSASRERGPQLPRELGARARPSP